MEIVTGEPAPTLEREAAVDLLHEMAAVVRTLFGVDAAPAEPAAADPASVRAMSPAPPVAQLPAALPLPVPAAAADPDGERAARAVLEEIAFLDE